MRSLLLLTSIILTSGALGEPFLPHEVPFESVAREHFDAVGVVRETSQASSAPLVVRIHVVGDAADAPLDEAEAWLARHAGIVLERHPAGAPVFLTRGDLAATSGRGTLGATVSRGMAMEVTDERLAPCIVAHEVLHFVGLKHVPARDNIMYPHCSRDFLDRAVLEDWQRDRLARVDAIRATTMTGVEVWASR